MHRSEQNFVDPETYEYVHYDDRYSRCEVCGVYHEVSQITGMNLKECLHDYFPEDEITCATGLGNKDRWKEIVKCTHKCPFCPKHGGENQRRKSRTDKYKDKRKGK